MKLPSGERVISATKGINTRDVSPITSGERFVACVGSIDQALTQVTSPHPLLSKTAMIAIMQVETGGYFPRAASETPAMGIAQFIQTTAYERGVLDYWNYGDAIKGLASYLDLCLKRMDDLKDPHKILVYGAMGYNSGPYRDRPDYLKISEAKNYGIKFVELYNKLGNAYSPPLTPLVYKV